MIIKPKNIAAALMLAALLLAAPALGGGWSWSACQRRLSPAAQRVLMQAQELAVKKKEQEALAVLEAFSRDRSGSVPALLEFMVGNLQFSLDRCQAAAASYQRVVQRLPECLPARENLGMVFLSLQQYRPAGEQFAAAAALARKTDSGRLDTLLKYAGTAWLLAADYERALPYFRELVEQRQNVDREAVRALVRAYVELRRPKEAEKMLVRLLDRFPDDAGYWRLLARVRLRREAYKSALAAYKILTVLEPAGAEEMKMMARLYRLLGVPAAAGRIMEDLYRQQPEVLKAADLDLMVSLYLEAGETDRALAWLRRKQHRQPSPRNLLREGEILFRSARYREAFKIFNRLTSLPEKQGYQFLLAGYCAWYAGDLPAARSAFNRACRYEKYRDRSLSLIAALEKIMGQGRS